MNRRRFFQSVVGGAALLTLKRRAYAFQQSPAGLAKFGNGQALPGLGAIPVASPNTTLHPGTDYYKIIAEQYTQQMHPALGGTKLWGYADVTSGSQNPVHGYLGPAIVSKKGRPVQITYINNLPPTHILPVDRTIMGTNMGEPDNRMVTHLHGGFTPWQYDGGPYSWFTPGAAQHGPDYTTGKKTDPRSYCIQKTLQGIAHESAKEEAVEHNLMFSGHNGFRFASDPFYGNGFIPTVRQLVERILSGR